MDLKNSFANPAGKAVLLNTARRFHRLLAALVGLSFAVSLSAVDKTYFVGDWINVNHRTLSMKAIQIGVQDGQTMARAWGACDPTPCKWGMARVIFPPFREASADVPSATVVFRTGVIVTRLVLRPGDHGTLVAEGRSHWTDNSGPDQTFSDAFRRAAPGGWDSAKFN